MAVAQNDTMNNKSVMQPTCKGMSNWWTPAENMGKSIIAGETTRTMQQIRQQSSTKVLTTALLNNYQING